VLVKVNPLADWWKGQYHFHDVPKIVRPPIHLSFSKVCGKCHAVFGRKQKGEIKMGTRILVGILTLLVCTQAFAIERRSYKTVTVTPTLDTSIYASGDRMGSVMTLSGVAMEDGGSVTLDGISIVDTDKQDAAFDVWLFNASPTLISADNAAISLLDSEMTSKAVGWQVLAASDYKDAASSSIAYKGNLNAPLKVKSGTKNLYALLVSRGTPTYNASALSLTFHFRQN
jgi:hypothetical protein